MHPHNMADHSSIHTFESLPFSVMYHQSTQGQRSNYNLFQNGSVSRLSQYEDSSDVLSECADNGAPAGASMNETDQISSAYWDMESFISTQPVGISRPKTYTRGHEEDWTSGSQLQDDMENYSLTRVNTQKLDSFSEAFYSRSISRIFNGREQTGYNVHASSSPPPPSIHTLTFPLVLSPPPTPLPPSSLSPPKRVSHPPAAQSMNQMQTQSEGPVHFFSHSCTSPISSGGLLSTHWLSLSTDTTGNGDITQQLLQDSSPSAVYPEGLGIHVKQLSTTDRETDCSLDTSPCSPLGRQEPQLSVLKQEHSPVTSEQHMTWSQITQPSQANFTLLNDSLNDAEGLNVFENKSIPGVRRTPLLGFSSSQNASSMVYSGVPYNSVLQSARLREDLTHLTQHYIPSPMLNPSRSGTGLFCNLISPVDRELWSEQSWRSPSQRHANIGMEFQADLPNLLEKDELNVWSEEPLPEDLLWKPFVELEESKVLQERVENLLDLSTSTALPGGTANLELALHSLTLCRGNILAALEMILFSNSTPNEYYHYAGSDVWQLNEQKLFHKAFGMYGKDFFLIQKMVKTKHVTQCVEFYYHSTKLKKIQKKQKEREQQEQQLQMNAGTFPHNTQNVMASKMIINPITVERLIHTPAHTPSFPCKQCGKMFYKIKSRNAHMKIHRQQQEDWREKLNPNSHLRLTQNLQNQSRTLNHSNQLVTQSLSNQMIPQSLIQNLVQSQAQLAFIQSKTQNACFTAAINNMSPNQSPQMAPKTPTLPLYNGHQQPWGAIHGSLEQGLYYD